MRVTFSPFPWHIDGDPAAAAWLAGSGVEDVPRAATYRPPGRPLHGILPTGSRVSTTLTAVKGIS